VAELTTRVRQPTSVHMESGVIFSPVTSRGGHTSSTNEQKKKAETKSIFFLLAFFGLFLPREHTGGSYPPVARVDVSCLVVVVDLNQCTSVLSSKK
jgi:hypothetical protein